jgi:amino acid permease
MDLGFLVPVAFFAMIVWIVKIISDNKIRKRALENGNLNQSMKYLWEKSYANKPLQNIKWAIIFAGVGVVILFAHIFCLAEAVTIGLTAIIVAVALLVYYKMEKKKC